MKQSEIFDKLYASLNDAQKKAVDTIEGPVMVIAGPGTGKTQILGARIGKILLETDTQPENILCLTYTEAGVVAMRRRLLSFIGPDAYKVNIYTFHAFCNDVIQDNLSLFEKTALDPVSELETIGMLRKLIDTFPRNHPLKRYRGDVYYEVKNLRELFSRMKREGYTPAFIQQKIDEYLEGLLTDDEYRYKRAQGKYKKGDLRENKLGEERERMEKLGAAAGEFDRFRELMQRASRYDFDDMIGWVIKAFEENRSLLQRYQEKYLYVLVDEFQDTSGTQNRLVQLLIEYWDQPNIFVVGDDDQSIFRFQGANVDNMTEFAGKYKKDLQTVILTRNYRSTQAVLDAARSLIERNEQRLVRKIEGLSKELFSANLKLPNPAPTPVIREYDTQQHEMIDVVHQVEALINSGTEPGKIAVIFKENKYGEALLQFFRLKNIPVYSKRDTNILEDPLIRKVFLILEYLVTEHELPYSGDEMLFEILHAEWFGVAPVLIADLSAEVAQRQYGDKKIPLRKLVWEKVNRPAPDLFTPAPDPALTAAAGALESLVSDAANLTVQNLFEAVIQKAGILRFIMQHPDKLRMLDTLTAFFNFLREETRRNPAHSLSDLVKLLQTMYKEELALPLVQITGSAEAVNLLTAHGSKGLEFTYVFFVGCNAGLWEKKRASNKGYSFPKNIVSGTDETADAEEFRRLFYVAVTRAETHLYISYYRFRADGKEFEPSRFVEEIRAEQSLPSEKPLVGADDTAAFQVLLLSGDQAPEIGRNEAAFIRRLLDNFNMNVTALNNYLRCPLEFYFKNLVRIPSPKNEATEFGSAAHYALEQLFRTMQENNNRFADKHVFTGWFDWYMLRHQESFTKEQFARRMEYGHIVLPAYYDTYVENWNKIVSIERSVRNVAVNGVPIKGKIDKLEFNGKQVTVVDYKTGNPDNANPKLKPPSEKDPNGGDYWRQAVFYKLLIDRSGQRDWEVVKAEFDFLEPDKKKEYQKKPLLITPSDIGIVTAQITDTWEKIQQHEFYTGCGKPDCHWCNFVKTNNMAVALHELTAEEEEA